MKDNCRILVFGDSLAYGAWDSEGGWVERLKRMAHGRTIESGGVEKFQVLNLGIGGDTSRKILARMEGEILARQSKSWENILVFSYGVNDERMVGGVSEVSLEELERNTREIIAVARKYADRVVFLEMPQLPFDEVEFKGKSYSDSRTQEYEARIESVVSELGAEWVPTRGRFEEAGLENLYAYDNLHPNDAGHEILAKAMAEKLRF